MQEDKVLGAVSSEIRSYTIAWIEKEIVFVQLYMCEKQKEIDRKSETERQKEIEKNRQK